MADELISRDELAAILFAIHDIDGKLSRIIRLLEGDDDAEAWTAEGRFERRAYASLRKALDT